MNSSLMSVNAGIRECHGGTLSVLLRDFFISCRRRNAKEGISLLFSVENNVSMNVAGN